MMSKKEASIDLLQLGRQRLRNARYTTVVSAFARIFNLAVSFITIPMTLGYLGKEEFGIWVIITSLTAILSFSDFGIGNGLINAVAHAHGKEDRDAIRIASTNTLAFLIIIASIGFLMSTFGIDYSKISVWLNISARSTTENVQSAMRCYVGFFFLSLPFNLVVKIQIGMQRGYMNGWFGILTGILTIASLYGAITFKQPLSVLVICLMGAPMISLALNTAFFYIVKNIDLRPKIKDISIERMKSLVGVGVFFLVLQLVAGMMVSADNFIIAQYVGIAEVTDFAIAMKLFGAIAVLNGLILQPLWPAIREAMSREDISWATRVLHKSMLQTGLLALFISILISISMPFITMYWLGNEMRLSLQMAFAFSLFAVCEALSMSIATYMNGMGMLLRQIVTGAALLGISVFIKVKMIPEYGVVVLPISTGLVTLIFVIIPLYLSLVSAKKLSFK